jgi:hypothetical protein
MFYMFWFSNFRFSGAIMHNGFGLGEGGDFQHK